MQKPNSLRAGLSLGAVVCLLGASFASAKEAPAPFAASSARGQTVYQKACAACHGETGDGKGQGAMPLDPKPRDFTTGLYKFRSTGLGELPTDSDLLNTVTNGLPGTQMPGFRHQLTAQERADVVAYIKKFSADFENAEEEAAVLVIPDPPAASPAFVAEGKNIYKTLDCYTCHGATGKGDGSASKGLKDGWGHPIKPQNLTRTHYKGGSDARSVYRTINNGLNGTPMSSFSGAFLFGSDKEISREALAAAYSKGEVETLKAYLASQPSAAKIADMSDEAKEALSQRRKWALVHYVRSLQKKPGIVGWLFIDDTEVTK
ncbi:MAG: serC 2 [Fibrobacteria bacterium]|nr:serC 2 [Fibrobacteria bacterium]